MIGRPAGGLGSNPFKAELAQIEFVHKQVNHPNWIILVDPVLQAFRKERALCAIRSLNEALHPIPHRQESLLTESHKAVRFHTARVNSARSKAPAQFGLASDYDR